MLPKSLIAPVSFVVGGAIAGVIFERVVLVRLARMAARTKWKGDEIVIGALRWIIFFLFFTFGVYGASQSLTLTASLLDIVQKVLLVIVILLVTLAVMRMAVGFTRVQVERAKVFPSTTILESVTKVVILTIGGLVILQTLGISITPMLTALGVGGLAIALALQDTLSNLFSGIHILVSKQLRPGDYVKLDSGEGGYVADINWRNTTIRTLPNNMIVVPNSKLASTIVMNYHVPKKEMAVLVQVGVGYGSDLSKVEEVTIDVGKEVMREVTGGVPQFEPFIRYHTFSDFSINFTVILRGKEFVDQYLVKHEFIKRLHKRYKEEGIEIPFPIRTVYMREETK